MAPLFRRSDGDVVRDVPAYRRIMPLLMRGRNEAGGLDPMYASVFIANLGSLKIDAAYHHNYEYGNIPIFVTVGRLADAVVAGPDGTVTTRKEVVLKWTFDERIDDGLYCAQALEGLRERLERPDSLR